jgi:hypothetical protein
VKESGTGNTGWRTTLLDPTTNAYAPTVTASTGTLTTASATGRWWRTGNLVFWTLSITITTNGTGAGVIRFDLPTTPAYSGSAYGYKTTNGVQQAAMFSAGSPTVTVNNNTGTYPGADGAVLRLSGQYFEA